MVAAVAVRVGRTVAYLDTDIGQTTVGPPTTIGLKYVNSDADLTAEALARPDAIYFVGDTSPQGHLLPLVVGAGKLAEDARRSGADVILVDTTGLIGGTLGQILKFHKLENLRPDWVVGFQRGEELEPILGVIQRFFSVDVVSLGVHPSVVPTSVEQRAEMRDRAMRRYFERGLQRFRIRPTVFMPTLPPLFDLSALDRLLVGLADGEGGSTGIGYLEHSADDGVLRLISPVAQPPKALRLGSVRLEDNYRAKRVDLRNLFGTE
jgi:polynucleotide 5'-hydroxyl-kinase GRC3/NOL9